MVGFPDAIIVSTVSENLFLIFSFIIYVIIYIFRPQLLAVGDVEGYTRIWKIPTKFSVNRSRADYREDK